MEVCLRMERALEDGVRDEVLSVVVNATNNTKNPSTLMDHKINSVPDTDAIEVLTPTLSRLIFSNLNSTNGKTTANGVK